MSPCSFDSKVCKKKKSFLSLLKNKWEKCKSSWKIKKMMLSKALIIHEKRSIFQSRCLCEWIGSFPKCVIRSSCWDSNLCWVSEVWGHCHRECSCSLALRLSSSTCPNVCSSSHPYLKPHYNPSKPSWSFLCALLPLSGGEWGLLEFYGFWYDNLECWVHFWIYLNI